MTDQGYYRSPTINRDEVVFVSEDDLWTVPASGGTARRLTTGLAEASTPFLSPDGQWLAFIGREEGEPEVYIMPASGGKVTRRTFLGATIASVAGWGRDGKTVIFASNAEQPMPRMVTLFAVHREGGLPKPLNVGPARYASLGPKGVVIGRHGADPARWKRYRGGTIGQLWIDRENDGEFQRLIELGSNLSHPMWVGSRIYFHSDHEGTGNIYSCTPTGRDLRRHTDHDEFYVRNPTTDGRRIVYHAGGDLYLLDPKRDASCRIEVDFHSPRTQRSRKYVDAARFLGGFDAHPSEHRLVFTTRGKPYTMASWEGAVLQHGRTDGVRYRLARWLHDGKRVVCVSDETGEESLVVFAADGSKNPRHLGKLPIGRALRVEASPTKDLVALTNHRHELILVDLGKASAKVLDRSPHDRINGFAWSPDGRYLAYSFQHTPHLCGLRLVEVPNGKPRQITRPVLRDVAPAFDPEGRYLYFLSFREFDPVYDSMHFELGFPRGMRPCLLTLRKDLPSPFVPRPKEVTPPPGKNGKPAAAKATGKAKAKAKAKAAAAKKTTRIDLDGIEDRVVPFPVSDGRYGQIEGVAAGPIYTIFPVEGALGSSWMPSDHVPKGMLEIYKLDDYKRETLFTGVSGFRLSANAKILVYRQGRSLRGLNVGEKPEDKPPVECNRRTGWIRLQRARVSVDPGAEWRQMFNEGWRLMRDHFWVKDMSGVDWRHVYDRYRPLVERVATRGEFSDLMWETQGELGTSHCYEVGGDYRPYPRYSIGRLGATLAWNHRRRGYEVKHIVRGDAGAEERHSPFVAPGVGVKEGDVIVAINGRRLSPTFGPHEALVNLAGHEVEVVLADGRHVTVKTLRSDYPCRYREWINANRRWVHQNSKGLCGYVHIPDMSAAGFSAFHRQYLAEVDNPALIVDVRFNGGGHVSQLLLEKLSRKRIGWNVQRWGQPSPYPEDSPSGPMVALTNEQAGSDGDIFSHCFKLMKLGPLIGRRTWGGVIGIWPRHALVDRSVTTQAEFAFTFADVGYGVENYGTDPDIDIDIAPHDFATGKDPQLEKALEVVMDLLEHSPPRGPKLEPRPRLTPPVLPGRNGAPAGKRAKTRAAGKAKASRKTSKAKAKAKAKAKRKSRSKRKARAATK